MVKLESLDAESNYKDVDIEKKYRVAHYNPQFVSEDHLDKFHTTDVKLKILLRSAFHVQTFRSAILGVTWRPVLLFLVLYYAFQIVFIQMDDLFDGLIDDSCKYKIGNASSCVKNIGKAVEQCAKNITIASADECRSFIEEKCKLLSEAAGECGVNGWVNTMKSHDSTAAKYLTFILGFYVGQMIKRWWDQVMSLPYIDPIANGLAGFVQVEFKDDLKSKEAALDLRKKIARYCLLSWTMCFSTISIPLQRKFKSGENYLEKGLLTSPELAALKQSAYPTTFSAQWWIPLNWASALINSVHPDSQGCKLKEQKGLIKELNYFVSKLHNVARYQTNPLPLIYSQAVMVAIYSWLLLGVFSSQYVKDVNFENQGTIKDITSILRTVPLFQIVKIILIYAWMKVANIVRNPFGMDNDYDINLEKMLDQNIWKASLTIKHLDKSVNFHE